MFIRVLVHMDVQVKGQKPGGDERLHGQRDARKSRWMDGSTEGTHGRTGGIL